MHLLQAECQEKEYRAPQRDLSSKQEAIDSFRRGKCTWRHRGESGEPSNLVYVIHFMYKRSYKQYIACIQWPITRAGNRERARHWLRQAPRDGGTCPC